MVSRSILDRRIKPGKDEQDEIYLDGNFSSSEESDATAQSTRSEDSLDDKIHRDSQEEDDSGIEDKGIKQNVKNRQEFLGTH